MTPIHFTDGLAEEYWKLFAESKIRPERMAQVRAAAHKLLAEPGWSRYQAVSDKTGVPPHVVGILHSLESNCSFDCHLHNGDPLTARTRNVPAGRPEKGDPPFAWETSAVDALRQKGLDRWDDWSVPGLAYALESYNGFGYRNYHPAVPSPYLWSFTTAYAAGKYVKDQVWSDTAISKQCGGMALLRALLDDGKIKVPPTKVMGGAAAASPAAGAKGDSGPRT